MVVGVNRFTVPEEQGIPITRINPDLEIQQCEKLAGLKQKRDNRKVDQLLDNLKSAAEKDENLMPVILEAVQAYATVGEISGTLKECYGEYVPGETLK